MLGLKPGNGITAGSHGKMSSHGHNQIRLIEHERRRANNGVGQRLCHCPITSVVMALLSAF